MFFSCSKKFDVDVKIVKEVNYCFLELIPINKISSQMLVDASVYLRKILKEKDEMRIPSFFKNQVKFIENGGREFYVLDSLDP